MSYRAKIVLEGGATFAKTPQVIARQEGRFTFICRIGTVFGNGNVVYGIGAGDRSAAGGFPDDCPVTIRLEGYETTNAVLHDGATIVLKRIGASEGSKISVQSLKASEEAKKLYNKGVQEITKKKWSSAQKALEQAVAEYPDYAQAWTDLGEVYLELSKKNEARSAFDKAIKADPEYARAYLPAAKLALDEGRNQDGLTLSETAIAINPTEFALAYFYNAVANFNLKKLDVAEKSARKAIELDVRHEAPRAEQLLGFIYAQQNNRTAALEHLRKYLKLSPQATDAPAVEKLIQKLEKK
jgi:tetratricopeptide (TPR) repeat protein